MKVNYSKCLHCGGCAGSCPMNAIYLNDYILEFSDACNTNVSGSEAQLLNEAHPMLFISSPKGNCAN